MEEFDLRARLEVSVIADFRGDTQLKIEKHEHLFRNLLLSIFEKDDYKSLLKVLDRDALIGLIDEYNSQVDEPDELIQVIKKED